MLRISTSLASCLLLATPLAAQTQATVSVRVGCTSPAAPDSLRAAPELPRTWHPNPDDLIVMEVESLDPVGNWELESLLPGFGGAGYFRWGGPNLFNTPGVDVLTFRFEIQNSGEYLLRVRNRHEHPDSSLENDCWVRMDNGAWTKLYQNTGSAGVGVWSFDARLESTRLEPKYGLTAGTHTFQISGRSRNFMIDRVHLMPQTTFGEWVQFPESRIDRQRPVLGTQFSFEVGDPTLAEGFTPGVARTLVYGNMPDANFPCGTVKSKFGEFLISMSSETALRAGPALVWNGATSPAIHTVRVPNDVRLIGFTVSVQGLMFQPGLAKVTDALDLVIGDV